MGIVGKIVEPILGLPADTTPTWKNSKIAFDYAIGGLPFLSAASTQFPLTRKTADYTKQQIDQSTEPGEQTLIAWWLRSQSSFHAGTGIVYEEPTGVSGDTIPYRFQDSAGVNVWTPGKVTLLNATSKDVTATTPIVMGCTDSAGNDCYFVADGSVLKRSNGNGTVTTVTWGGTGTILSMTNDGTNYYVADNVGIWKGTLTGGAGSKVWNTGSSSVVIGWVKQRLMAAVGLSLYELAGGSPPTLPTPVYTHPNASWTWTSVCESPSAIYFGGYAGSSSAIYMLTLDTSGSVPALTSGILAAEMPEGEVIYSLLGNLGTYVAIGSNKGCRIADVQNDGSLQYGPLSVTFPSGVTGKVCGLTAVDRFIYGTFPNAINGNSGLFRLDLGTSLGFKQFAYASDLQSHVTGSMTSVTRLGASDRLVFGVNGNGAYVQSSTVLEATGYLKTGNIRYHILEPKLFKFVRVWTKPLTKGGVSITVNDHADTARSLVSFTAGLANDPLDEVTFPTTLGPQEWISITIGLTRDADTVSGPTVTAYQIKALPAQKRQRTIVLPLLCYDKESDANGTQYGSEGTALKRLEELEAVEEAGDAVLFQDLTKHGGAPRLVVIDNLQFVQQAPPKLANRSSGWGGVLLATLRAVT